MSDEKKKYDIVGTVSIGTDEYRDLIEAVKDAEAEAEKYRSLYWKEQDISREANRKADALSKKVDVWEEFLADHATVNEDWAKYMARKLYSKAEEREF